MKKVLLFLSLALFVAAGVVTATKVKKVNATTSEMISTSTGNHAVATASLDGDDKTKKSDKKATNNAKSGCSGSCAGKSKGAEAKCAEAKCTDVHKSATGKSCCDSKEKSCEKDKK